MWYSASAKASLTFDFCHSTSIPVLTTSTYVVAWPQGDQILGGGHVTHGARAEPQNPENTLKNALDVGGEKKYMYCHSVS